jgi:hypothetical protein
VFGAGFCQSAGTAQCSCEPVECDHCGDGQAGVDEACDSGGASGGNGCAINCTLETVVQIDTADVLLGAPIADVPTAPLAGQMTVAHGGARNPPPAPCLPGVIRALRFAPTHDAAGHCVCIEGRQDGQFGPGNAGEIILRCPSSSDFRAQATLAVWLLDSTCDRPGTDAGADSVPCTDDDGPRSGAHIAAAVRFSGSQTGAPAATPTHTPSTSYQLTSESRISLADGTEEAASGSFAVIACYSPNTFFAYRIGAIEIATDSVLIRSADPPNGAMEALTILPEDSAVTFNASIVVDGEPNYLSGRGPFDPGHSGEMINLNLKFGTVDLRLQAIRIGKAGTPSPEHWCF